MVKLLKRAWKMVRRLSGDDAYEQYLAHFATHHAQDGEQPLTRRAFFKQWQEKKWTGVKRCC